MDGGELHVERTGSGPPVILLHSGALDASMWDPVLDALAARRTVVRFDARGSGRSSTPTADWRPDDDLLAVLDAHGLERAALVGSSYGGGTAADLALAHAERVTALVLAGPGLTPIRFDDPFVQEQHRRQAEAQAAGDADAWVEALLRYTVDGPSRTPQETPPAVREACRAMALRTVQRHHTAQGRVRTRDAAEHLERITSPTLLITGTGESPDLLRVVADAHARIPNAERIDVPGPSHMVSMEAPQEFAAATNAFLDRVGA